MKNRFQVLQEMIIKDTDAHDIWHGTREAIMEKCKEILGPKKHKHKDWISVGTLQKIQVTEDKKEPGSRSRSKTAQDLSGLSGFPARFERFERFGRFGRFFWKNRSNRSNIA